jgi:RND family efflux transporter MFP subunit
MITTPGCREEKRAAAQPVRPTVVTVAKPLHRDVTEFNDFTARTEANESVDVRARVAGYLNKVLFTEGSLVKQGDVLFEIDRRPYKAELDKSAAQLRVAKVRLEQAKIEFRRVDEIYKNESATKIEWERQQALQNASEAEVAAAEAALEQAQLNYDWTLVTAPITGRISRSLVDAGNLIQGGYGAATLLTTIVAIDPIYAYMDLDERCVLTYQKAVREGRLKSVRNEDQVPVHMQTAIETGFPHEGHIDFVDNKMDPNTGTLRVRATFKNEDSLISPGLFVRVRLPLGSPQKGLLVTERALGVDQGQRFVCVVNSKNVVEYRKIEVGPLDEGLRAVKSGVGPDDWVIVNGLQRVRPGVGVDPKQVDMLSMITTDTSQPAVSAPPATQPAQH